MADAPLMPPVKLYDLTQQGVLSYQEEKRIRRMMRRQQIRYRLHKGKLVRVKD